MSENDAASAPDMVGRLDRLRGVADRQMFFVGGAPRSGTTWLQQMLDAHPAVCCRGEALFWKELALPLAAIMETRGKAIADKNRTLFAHTGGYPLPQPEEVDTLFGVGVLSAFDQQLRSLPNDGVSCQAVGEKTPENVFLFPRIKRLFPGARLIVIARDPRDVIASAWHMFVQRLHTGVDLSARKHDFVRASLDTMDKGARTMVHLAAIDPASCMLLTYESLSRDTTGLLGTAFRFLGVSDAPEIVSAVVAHTTFERQSGGRRRGDGRPDAFLRRGTVGDWRDTLDDGMNAIIIEKLGWMFPRFGWEP